MPIQPTYPGVYVQEVPSGVRTIVGVSTSVALFIGRATRGPLNRPIQCLSYTDFERVFSSNTALSDMPYHVRLFFLNGGTNCYVVRIANGASTADVQIEQQVGNSNVLRLAAKQHGLLGETIRANVTYGGQQPEHTFNIDLFRVETNALGTRVTLENESFLNLSMNPNSPRYAADFISQNSQLVNATDVAAAPGQSGYAQSARPIEHDGSDAGFLAALDGLTGTNTAASSQFQVSVDGNPFVTIDLSGIDVGAAGTPAALGTAIETAITDAHNAANILGIGVTVSFPAGPTPTNLGPATDTSVIRIASDSTGPESAVVVIPSTTNDAAAPLMLGTAQGGLEVNGTTSVRPAPNGVSMLLPDYSNPDFAAFAALAQSEMTTIDIDSPDDTGTVVTSNIPVDLVTTNAADALFVSDGTPVNGNRGGVREKLTLIRDAINDWQTANPRTFFVRARLDGSRLTLYPTRGEANAAISVVGPNGLAGATLDFPDLFTENVRYYSVGAGGTGDFQTPAGAPASDGVAPQITDYDNAYRIVESEVDLFNLLVLPPDRDSSLAHSALWGPASAFCQSQRAFLIMDAPTSWTNAQTAANGVADLRVGLVNDHSAVFYPRVQINDNGRQVLVGPAGAIAGLMARIDASRGIWKAPAGTEASIRGITGLAYRFSDRENGVLNPQAVNTLRIFPNGIVNWGARTMDGDDDFASEWKYIPVRRTALFIEESLYRGLQWVVFEPNDEPLWAQIRLNVGAFMHNLFRQGAFQGTQKRDAYFVKCDSETTTQNDINLGIVNILVGFAPLKPAEFVILSLQQMTGQIEV